MSTNRRKTKKTIIVTGNGFDLQCGLNSNYSDFFDWSDHNIKEFNDVKKGLYDINQQEIILEAFSKNLNLTVWDLYFMIKSVESNSRWADIEAEINESIQSRFWDGVLKEINYFESTGEWGQISANWYFALIMQDRYYKSHNWLRHQYDLPIKERKVIERSDFYNKLFNELSIFERRFSQYIKEELNKKSDYFQKQDLLINQLIKSTTGKGEPVIFTFNYTPYKPGYKYVNIHGDLDFPIIGISGNENSNSDAKIFEKSERRLNFNLLPLVDYVKNQENAIIFYGTSFNKMDADYYKMIIEQFGSNFIYFCYSNYDGENREFEQMSMAEKLIDKLYPNQFGPKREKRKIQFKEIKVIS